MKLLCSLLLALIINFVKVPHSSGEAELLKAPPIDVRTAQLEKFFDRYKCPKPYYIEEYLDAADKNNIPFTLLPAISIQESTCGKHYLRNNFWGWNSARTGFQSVQNGIYFVSEQLATGRYYKNKTIEKKLRSYNPNPAYAPKIIKLMKQIDQYGDPKISK